ncbi:acyl carrier protein [Clostridium acidisoli DSM 12555]|jgi:acyl carrier protein|uniref:Acyl carrier protein n=1 Tax=Clostridium acidisoli DSM 12555 TaxID=1121291 RepID=A0A1W1XQH9_9CLOT|nr:acyl carrier protein [Clostridium acidisoli]SMC26229.1 acyl carrier protein [Clostridium acidisoli DSM 12555]
MIFETVKRITAEQLNVDENTIKMYTAFNRDLEADSLDLFQIIMEIEDEFNIQIEDTDDIITVEDAVKFIKDRIKQE